MVKCRNTLASRRPSCFHMVLTILPTYRVLNPISCPVLRIGTQLLPSQFTRLVVSSPSHIYINPGFLCFYKGELIMKEVHWPFFQNLLLYIQHDIPSNCLVSLTFYLCNLADKPCLIFLPCMLVLVRYLQQ